MGSTIIVAGTVATVTESGLFIMNVIYEAFPQTPSAVTWQGVVLSIGRDMYLENTTTNK